LRPGGRCSHKEEKKQYPYKYRQWISGSHFHQFTTAVQKANTIHELTRNHTKCAVQVNSCDLVDRPVGLSVAQTVSLRRKFDNLRYTKPGRCSPLLSGGKAYGSLRSGEKY
jgi:hypothetical protein